MLLYPPPPPGRRSGASLQAFPSSYIDRACMVAICAGVVMHTWRTCASRDRSCTAWCTCTQNKTDGARAKLYGKMGKLISQAVRAGGPSEGGNSRLRDLLAQARASNIPKDIIDRNIQNASSPNQADYVEVRIDCTFSCSPHLASS